MTADPLDPRIRTTHHRLRMAKIDAVLVLCVVLAGCCDAFSPQVGFNSRLAHRSHASSSVHQRQGFGAALGLRVQEGGGGGEKEEIVEITREELKALAEQAGIRVQIGDSESFSSPL